MNKPILSLCIPTNGVTQWVKPVLDSIYSQNVDNDLFEVVLGDNGNNEDFKDSIKDYLDKYNNLHYYKIESELFLSEIETYKKAKGVFIKFVNHRNVLRQGSIDKFIKFAKDNEKEKPIVYFANGAVIGLNEIYEFDNFNDFVKRMQNYSSWSAGMAIWKEDLDRIIKPLDKYNYLFPHTDVLFNERNRNKYIVDNTEFFDQIDSKKTPKGVYDFFYAFGIEYPNIIKGLLTSKDITEETYNYVLERNLEYIGKWYMLYVKLNKYTAHDLSSADSIFGVYYTKPQMYKAIIRKSFWKANKEIRRKLGLKI